MPITWEQISGSEDFQGLDDDAKENVRAGFYNDFVAPELTAGITDEAEIAARVEEGRVEWDQATKPEPGILEKGARFMREKALLFGKGYERSQAADELTSAAYQRQRAERFDKPTTMVRGVEGGARPAFETNIYNPQVAGRLRRESLESAQSAAEHLANTAKMPESEALTKFMEAEGFIDSAKALADPELVVDVIAESGYPMAKSIAASTVGGATLGPAGAMGGMFGSSFDSAYDSEFMQTLHDEGVDLTDPDDVYQALTDKDLVRLATSRGIRYGAPIAAAETLSLGVAGKLADQMATAPIKAIAKQTAVDASAGAGGEAVGSLAAHGEVDPKEVLLEGIAEIPGGALDIMVQRVAGRGAENEDGSVSLDENGTKVDLNPDGTLTLDPTIKPLDELMAPMDVSRVVRPTPTPRAPLTPDKRNLAQGLALDAEPQAAPAAAPGPGDYADILAGDLGLADGLTEAPASPTRGTKIPQAGKELDAIVEPTLAGKGDAITAPQAIEEDPFAQKEDVYDPLTLAEPGARIADEKTGQVEYEAQIDTAGLALQEEVTQKPAVDEGKVEPVDEAKIEEVRTLIQGKLNKAPDSAVKSMLSQVGIKQSGTKQERVDRVVAAREVFERYGRFNTEAQLRSLFKGEENVRAAELLTKIMPNNQSPGPGLGGAGSWQNARIIRSLVNRMGGSVQESPGNQETEVQYVGDKAPKTGKYQVPARLESKDQKPAAQANKLKLIDVDIPVRVRETGETEMVTYKANEAVAYEDGRIDSLSKLLDCLGSTTSLTKCLRKAEGRVPQEDIDFIKQASAEYVASEGVSASDAGVLATGDAIEIAVDDRNDVAKQIRDKGEHIPDVGYTKPEKVELEAKADERKATEQPKFARKRGAEGAEQREGPEVGRPERAEQVEGPEAEVTVGGQPPRDGWAEATLARDEVGPLSLYSGKPADLTKDSFLDKNLSGVVPESGLGWMFTSNLPDAELTALMAESNVQEVKLDLAKVKVYGPNEFPELDSVEQAYEIKSDLKDQGYDAIMYDMREAGGGVNFVVFSPDSVIAGDSRKPKSKPAYLEEGDLIFARKQDEHTFEVARKERKVGKGRTLAAEKDVIRQKAKDLGLTQKAIRDRVLDVKSLYPKSDGWEEIVLRDVEVDDKGNIKPIFQPIPYAFTKGNEDKMVDAMVSLFQEVKKRADAGDKNAKVILRQEGWYKNMRTRLRAEFGGLGDMFADLLGATSPQTAVPRNYEFALEALRKAQRGDYDDIMADLGQWVEANEIREAELTRYVAREQAKGRTLKAIKETDLFKKLNKKIAYTGKPPLRDNGTKYGANSIAVMKALGDTFRIVQGGTAPKARNFSGNLIGLTTDATIDVWAARELRDVAGLSRIPPAAESDIKGKYAAGAERVGDVAGGEFGFGQKVFKRAADELGVDPDGLQAMVWFMTKERWTENNWTTKAGEGGSFEQQMDKYPVNRYFGLLSMEQSKEFQGKDYSPDDAAMKVEHRKLIRAAYDDPNVIVAKSNSTLGRYGADEKSFDIEVTTQPNQPPMQLRDEMLRIAKENNQHSFGLARAIDMAKEEVDYLKHRPGLEIYVQQGKPLEQMSEMVDELNKAGVEFFTFIVDPRNTSDGRMGNVVGVRMLYTPEFIEDPQEVASKTDAEIVEMVKGAEDYFLDIVDKVDQIDGVSYNQVGYFETEILFGSEYEKAQADRAKAAGRPAGKAGEGAWSGRTVREGVAAADRHAKISEGDGEGDLVQQLDSLQQPDEEVDQAPKEGKASAVRTPATKNLQAAIEAYLGESFEPGAYTEVSVSDPGVAGARAAAEVFGKKVVVFRVAEGAYDFEGVVLPNDPDTVYINENSDVPFLKVAGHELLHTMKRDHPDLYETLQSVAREHVESTAEYKAWVDKSRDKEGKGPASDALIEEEMLADFTGEAFGTSEFWKTVESSNPSKFKEIKQAILDFIDDFLRKLSGTAMRGKQYYNDTVALRDAVAKSFSEYAARQKPEIVLTQPKAVSDVPMFARENRTAAGPQVEVPRETLFRGIVRRLQDRFDRLRTIQDQVEISDEVNVYFAEEEFHGKVEQQFIKFEQTRVEPLIKKISDSGMSMEQVDEYLYAKHAPEANAHIQKIDNTRGPDGSGMSDKEAADVIEKYSYDEINTLEDIASDVYAINQGRLSMLEESGMISEEDYLIMSEYYNYYVPLKGRNQTIMNDVADRMYNLVGGFRTPRKLGQRRKGRRSKAQSPLVHTVAQYEEAIINNEKNEVNKVLLNLVQENPDVVDDEGNRIWDIISEDNIPTVPVFNADESEIRYVKDPNWKRAADVLNVKVDGENVLIKLNDPLIARAMNNMGIEKLSKFTRMMGGINRYLAAVNTSYNPEFVLSNAARDIQTALINLQGEQEIDVDVNSLSVDVLKSLPFALKGIYQASRNPKDQSVWGKHFKDYAKAGAKVGFFGLKDFHQKHSQLKSLLLQASGTTTGNVLKTIKALGKYIEDVNSAVENSARLAVFVEAQNHGLSNRQAAHIAKNLTVNFNRKGELGTFINAYYLFYNASIQGTARLWGAAKNKRVQKILGSIVVFSYALSELNRVMGGEDDDGEDYYDKIPQFVKERNLIIMTPWAGDGSFITVPLPYGYNVPYVMGETISSSVHGGSPMKGAINVADAIIGSFNPIGGADSEDYATKILKLISPTQMDPVVELATNENFYGSPIMPEKMPWNEYLPDSHRYWNSTSSLSKWAASALNELTGGDKYTPGKVDVSPDSIEHLYEFFTGSAGRFVKNSMYETPKAAYDAFTGEKDLDVNKIPFARRLFKRPTDKELTRSFYDNTMEVEAALQRVSAMERAKDLKARVKFVNENRPLLRMEDLYKEAKKDLSDINKRKAQIQNEDIPKAEKQRKVRLLDERSLWIKKKFNKRFGETVNK